MEEVLFSFNESEKVTCVTRGKGGKKRNDGNGKGWTIGRLLK